MKAIIVIAILALLVVAGCAPTAPSAEKVAGSTVKTDPAVAEVSQDFVDDTDTVEIGEMI